jgi:hypothetical protein
MSALLGIGTLLIGLAYVGLGVWATVEVVQFRKTRGISWFGIGFALMAASCGPHHVIHALAIFDGMDHNWLLGVVTVIGLPAGLVFVALRVEALFGGRGDRFISCTPWWIPLMSVLFFVAIGVLVDRALAVDAAAAPMPAGHASMSHADHMAAMAGAPAGIDVSSVAFLTNMFVAVTYSMVGWCLFRTQVRRRPAAGGWSLSGISLAAVFPTCALMHLVYAMTAQGHPNALWVDLLGVPASVYFLWVVYRLYRESIVDWNRRPIVGDAARPCRPSPWNLGVG